MAHFPAPRWQTGNPPYKEPAEKEGLIIWENGKPTVQATDELRFSLTIPKKKMPANGFPIMAFGHGMGGNFRQVIDRSDQYDVPTSDTIPAGEGPSMTVARRGIAAGGLDAVGHGNRKSGSAGGGTTDGLKFFQFY